MCLIIHKPQGKRIPQEYINNAKRINPHGFGYTYLDTGETSRTLSYTEVDKILDTDRPLVAHFRYATVGLVNKQNVHPFPITNAPRYEIYSNGTIDGYGNITCSDIRFVAERILGNKPRKTWVPFLKKTDTRFAIVDTLTGKVKRINTWHERGGIYYSKDNCFGKYRVAVYGTLKQGFGNSHLLKTSKFVEAGRTKSRYPLVVDGLPYLFEEEGRGQQVRVEVYDVSHRVLARLDSLEGHPAFYERKQIDIELDDWSETKAWVYFARNASCTSEDGHHHAEYFGAKVSRYWEKPTEEELRELNGDDWFVEDEDTQANYEMSRRDYLIQ